MNSAPPVGPPIPPSVIPFSQDQCINFIGFLFIQNQGPVKTLKSQSPFFEINYYHAQYHSRWEEGIILTNPFQCYLSVFVFRCVYECLFVCLCVCMCVCVCVCVWCVFCLFTPFLPVLFVSHRKNLVLQHVINRYMAFTSG